MADLGRAALVVSFGLALYALVGGSAAAITRHRRLADSARLALLACFGSTVIASAVLIHALVTHDFSYAYVQAHTSRDLSTVYSLTAFWGGEEGSLLLWLLVLTGYAALAVTLNRKLLKDIVVWVVPVIGGLATFFSFMLVAVASPFTTVTRAVPSGVTSLIAHSRSGRCMLSSATIKSGCTSSSAITLRFSRSRLARSSVASRSGTVA